MAVGTEAASVRMLPGVRWGAVVAGVFLAIASHIVLGLVGGSLRFAAAPAGSAELGAGAAIWGLVTPFVATLLGAWLAVGMAGAAGDKAASTLHGVMVWCIGLIAGAIFLAGTIGVGAVAAGTASRAEAARIFRGETGRVTARADQAGAAAAAAMGGAALASISGLLGAVAGVGIARSRRSGRGLGWRLAIQRREERGEERFAGRREERELAPPYGEPRPPAAGEPRRDVGAPPPTDPYHH